ncbi:MAG TPA: PHP domain-containing protein, partial [bacterium]|nr:PHP domain-containing protein [bacterium]
MYVHLHNHFLIDSSIKIKDALEKIKKDNQPAIAITDHNLVSLHFAFYYESIKQNIKPILGCECYFVDDAESKGAASNKDHIILYAKNIDGLANLYRLIIESRLKYSVSDKASLIDWQLLEKYRDGLIVTNACIYGALANSIVKKSDKYLYRADRFVNLFGDDFFFEIGYHYFPEQLYANEAIIKLAEKYGKTAVLVNDAHHLNKEDWY